MYNDEHFEPNPRDKEIVESELGQQTDKKPETESTQLDRLISDQSAKSGKSEKTVKTEFAFFSSSDESVEDLIDEGIYFR